MGPKTTKEWLTEYASELKELMNENRIFNNSLCIITATIFSVVVSLGEFHPFIYYKYIALRVAIISNALCLISFCIMQYVPIFINKRYVKKIAYQIRLCAREHVSTESFSEISIPWFFPFISYVSIISGLIMIIGYLVYVF